MKACMQKEYVTKHLNKIVVRTCRADREDRHVTR